ncbi:NAD-dependent epimerase/dehydratase family protein [Chryseobacterium lathyri]|uniref:Nucleoside-diphosphate-sugar epimerase n=1 Tax=Chryseobacterium lathyri TaxID=395933 RepID=A0ABT9SR09_9FLAO|nr:NAD(P)-dependent oxidoreductase [Chryseobacterium lathyri]MDP9961852.1 nucleoside-diphosphate-sugar epimerase [Chryseobacterium lathyri]MDQ0064211.1 nucleoside-diphosphate-sugar epimerase [Chryseobacterium lathyri]
MRKKILVTGANGFLGFYLVKAAIQKNLEVYAGVREGSEVSHLKDIDAKLTYLNYSDLNSLKENFEINAYDYVIHAAGVTKTYNNQIYRTVNADYTKNVALAAKSIAIKKMVFISSLAALGPTIFGEENVLLPDTAPKPITSYGRSKLIAEQTLKDLKNLEWIILRPTAIYGPREKDLLTLFKMINRGLEIYLGKKKQTLSFVYVEDIAEVAVQSCFADTSRECYNISDGKRYTIQELSGIIKKKLKVKTVKIIIPIFFLRLLAGITESVMKRRVSIINKDKVSELIAENWFCSIEKARRDLSYTPQFTLDKGITDTIEWYKKNKWI